MGKQLLTVILLALLTVTGTALVLAEVHSPAAPSSSGGGSSGASTNAALDNQKLVQGQDAGVPAVDGGLSSQKVDESFYQAVNGAVETPDPILTVKPLITDDVKSTPVYQKAREATITELVKSLTAIEDREVGLSDTTKRKIADAALSAQEKTGVDATFLLAIARMESDFRNIINLNAACKFGFTRFGCYADCGMTQHHVRGPLSYVKRRCKQLADDPTDSFLQSATELASHIKWCNDRNYQSWHRPIRRCILNRYNMGPFYRTEESCDRNYACEKFSRQENETIEELAQRKNSCKRQWRACLGKSAYWKKVTCFEYGARKQQKSAHSCRWCFSLKHVASYYYPKSAEPVAAPAAPVVPQNPTLVQNKPVSTAKPVQRD